jgi:hypothetical protein
MGYFGWPGSLKGIGDNTWGTMCKIWVMYEPGIHFCRLQWTDMEWVSWWRQTISIISICLMWCSSGLVFVCGPDNLFNSRNLNLGSLSLAHHIYCWKARGDTNVIRKIVSCKFMPLVMVVSSHPSSSLLTLVYLLHVCWSFIIIKINKYHNKLHSTTIQQYSPGGSFDLS